MNENFNASIEPFAVRRFEAKDHPEVLALWQTAQMRLQPVSEIMDVLIKPGEGDVAGNHLTWVAEAFGRTVGSATVIHDNPSVANLRIVYVAPDFASPPAVAKALAETAIREVYDRGFLKLVVYTDSPSNRLNPALHDLGFEFSRERLFDGERVIEFYRNLYERPQLSLAFEGKQIEENNGTNELKGTREN
jgi:hypothetical protein